MQTRPLNDIESPGLEVLTPPARWSNPHLSRWPIKHSVFSTTPPHSSFDHTSSGQAPRNPFKLKPLAFGLLVAAITALIVGAAVGGGVGGALSKSSASTATATTTVTPTSALISSPTNFVIADPSSVTDLDVDCVSLAKQPYTYRSAFETGPFNQSFQFSCAEDLPDKTAGANEYYIRNLAQMVAYRIEDCIASCVSLNSGLARNWCFAAVFDTALNDTYLESQANCFLKNSTGAGTLSRDSRMTAQLIS